MISVPGFARRRMPSSMILIAQTMTGFPLGQRYDAATFWPESAIK